MVWYRIIVAKATVRIPWKLKICHLSMLLSSDETTLSRLLRYCKYIDHMTSCLLIALIRKIVQAVIGEIVLELSSFF